MVATDPAAARASAATSARVAPASAEAPATLWTRTDPGPGGLLGAGERDVVGHDDDLDGDPLGPGHLGGEAEVEPVAGVVLDDQEGPEPAGGGPDGPEDGVGAGRGEDLAEDGGREHPGADVARVRRLVAAPTARDQGDPAVAALGGVGPDDHGQARQAS